MFLWCMHRDTRTQTHTYIIHHCILDVKHLDSTRMSFERVTLQWH